MNMGQFSAYGSTVLPGDTLFISGCGQPVVLIYVYYPEPSKSLTADAMDFRGRIKSRKGVNYATLHLDAVLHSLVAEGGASYPFHLTH